MLWEPCLEFQWHHFVPHEICVRSYAQIAADISLVVLIHFAAAHATFHPCGGLGNPYVRTLAACGVANAYLLQFAHRQAHFPKAQRHPVAAALQRWGLLVSEEMHRQHHRTFDTGTRVCIAMNDACSWAGAHSGCAEKCVNAWMDVWMPSPPSVHVTPTCLSPTPFTTGITTTAGFPVLSGLSDPVVNALHACVPNQWAWLALFLGMTLGGLQALTVVYLAGYRALTGDTAAVVTLFF